MKTLTTILLLALVSSAMAAENDAQVNAERYVADDLVNVTLPSGEVVTRLVSRSGITAQQYWVDSVYGKHGSLVIFQDGGVITPGATGTQFAHTDPRRIATRDLALNDRIDVVSQAPAHK